MDQLTMRNNEMKKELDLRAEEIKELQMSNNSSVNRESSDAVQKLRFESQQMYQRLVEEQAKTSELDKQNKKLQKYESIVSISVLKNWLNKVKC